MYHRDHISKFLSIRQVKITKKDREAIQDRVNKEVNEQGFFAGGALGKVLGENADLEEVFHNQWEEGRLLVEGLEF